MNAALLLAVMIAVDQAGYPMTAPKIAIVRDANVQTFSVTRDGAVVLNGTLSEGIADFSAITQPGRYELHVGDARAAVTIGSDPYRELLQLAIRAYTGQRCGTAVDIGGGYSHPACHLTSAFHRSSGRSGRAEITGGWHDAGDYGRYVVNSGISTATLLWTFEMFPGALPRDFLDEIRWNIDWMRSMQDSDGGVWVKQTSLDFPRFIQPQDDHSLQYVIGKSSCATGDFAAVMAIASRVYRDPALLDAAKRAYAWLDKHPKVTFRNPPGVKTGEYGDHDCSDERLWAAAEIWRDQPQRAQRSQREIPDWQNVGTLAVWRAALSGDGESRKQTIAAANAAVARAKAHAYRIPMRPEDYVWGSNAVAANYAMLFLVANEIQPDRQYLDAALDILHYLLGRNPFSMSWVTAIGERSVQHPHHRPSVSDRIEAPWPGLLAGGPNGNRQDPVLRRMPRGTPPELMYKDDQESYASNEVAINWNAPLVFVVAALRQKLQGETRPVAGTVSWNRPRSEATDAASASGDCGFPPRK